MSGNSIFVVNGIGQSEKKRHLISRGGTFTPLDYYFRLGQCLPCLRGNGKKKDLMTFFEIKAQDETSKSKSDITNFPQVLLSCGFVWHGLQGRGRVINLWLESGHTWLEVEGGDYKLWRIPMIETLAGSCVSVQHKSHVAQCANQVPYCLGFLVLEVICVTWVHLSILGRCNRDGT